jgi:hypothetical protein
MTRSLRSTGVPLNSRKEREKFPEEHTRSLFLLQSLTCRCASDTGFQALVRGAAISLPITERQIILADTDFRGVCRGSCTAVYFVVLAISQTSIGSPG